MKFLIRVLLLLQLVLGDKKFAWKLIKSNEHVRLTTYGSVAVCGIAKGVEPLYPGELRAHNCDLLQCRKTVTGLEEWACIDCVQGTPECEEYKRKQSSRQSERAKRSHERSIIRSRKIRYRKMKRAAILEERKEKRAKRLAAKKAKKAAREERRRLREERRSHKKKSN